MEVLLIMSSSAQESISKRVFIVFLPKST